MSRIRVAFRLDTEVLHAVERLVQQGGHGDSISAVIRRFVEESVAHARQTVLRAVWEQVLLGDGSHGVYRKCQAFRESLHFFTRAVRKTGNSCYV